jgi:hypothetical protein
VNSRAVRCAPPSPSAVSVSAAADLRVSESGVDRARTTKVQLNHVRFYVKVTEGHALGSLTLPARRPIAISPSAARHSAAAALQGEKGG